ncbi:MAG: dienelactone hydrolase family protein [Candidatus Omnitrophica bacterium]|nr:dienelactone hydrolase family protein [Candidatus Omnitrophota bacterium]
MSCACAELKTRDIDYQHGNAVFEGYLVYDDQLTGQRPGILVAHEWTGLNDYTKMRADMLARLGYVSFAFDIYGKGIRPNSVAEANAKNIKAQLLVLHGADDPFVPQKEVAAFEREMQTAKVRYQFTQYPGAVHGFTNPANKGELNGALYNPNADKKSWEEMLRFLNRILK